MLGSIGAASVIRMVSCMNKRVHLILSCWIFSHLGHAVLSTLYEKTPATFVVPAIYTGFVLLVVGTWKRNRWAAKISAIAAVMTIVVQGLFMWKRDAYGSLSMPVLVFDILGVACSLLYLMFYFSRSREHYLAEPKTG